MRSDTLDEKIRSFIYRFEDWFCGNPCDCTNVSLFLDKLTKLLRIPMPEKTWLCLCGGSTGVAELCGRVVIASRIRNDLRFRLIQILSESTRGGSCDSPKKRSRPTMYCNRTGGKISYRYKMMTRV